MTEKFFCFRQLDDLAFVDNRNSVRNKAYNRQVMRDEQIGQASALLQTVEQVQYLRTDRNVQRRDRLVGNDELRLHDQRAGNTDTLSLTTRELVWETGSELRQQTYLVQNALYFFLALLLILIQMEVDQTFRDDVINLCSLIQRSHWVLENHLAFTDDFLIQFLVNPTVDPAALEENFTSRGWVDSQDRTANGGLAGTGFTYQREGFAFVNVKVDIVYRNKFFAARSKSDLYVF